MWNPFISGVACVLVAVLLGCGDRRPPAQQLDQRQPAQQQAARSDGHTAANALDWAGTYEGVIPCADCEGIKTVVTLHIDLTYAFSAAYLGKPGKPFETTGTFSWNEAGNTVRLAGLENRPNKYFVGEGYLLQLDMDGKKIEGESARNYTLKKQESAAKGDGAMPLIGTTWYLKSLQGEEIPIEPNTKKPFIVLRPEGSRMNGFGGCNTFAGTYEAKAPDRLSFSKVAATRMMCADMRVETMLFEILGETDSYAIRDDKLMLHKARMAPLAVFEAGPAQ
jgi:copper homeostasis protein (lipoprotein)